MSTGTIDKPKVLTVLEPMTKIVLGDDDRLRGWFIKPKGSGMILSYHYPSGNLIGACESEEVAVNVIMKIGE